MTFADKLPNLGEKVQEFMSYMKPKDGDVSNWSTNYIGPALRVINDVAAAAKDLTTGNVDALASLLGEEKKIIPALSKFVTDFFTEIKLPSGIKGKDAGIDDFYNFLRAFKILCEAIGSLGNEVGTVLGVLTRDVFFGMTDKTWRNSIESNGLIALSQELIDIYKKVIEFVDDGFDLKYSDGNIKHHTVNFDSIVKFFAATSDFFKSLSNMTYLYSAGELILFLNDVGQIGESVKTSLPGLFEAIDMLGSYTDDSKLLVASQVMDILTGFTQLMADFYKNGTGYGLAVSKFIDYDQIDEFASLASHLVNALDKELRNEKSEETLKNSGKTLAAYVYEGMQLAMDTDESLKLTITPVINTSKMRSDLSGFFGIENPEDFAFGTAFSGAVQRAFSTVSLADFIQQHDYTVKLEEMSGKMDTLNDSINGIATAFNGAKLVADTGALAVQMGPDIDRYLAEMGVLYLNHVATK